MIRELKYFTVCGDQLLPTVCVISIFYALNALGAVSCIHSDFGYVALKADGENMALASCFIFHLRGGLSCLEPVTEDITFPCAEPDTSYQVWCALGTLNISMLGFPV